MKRVLMFLSQGFEALEAAAFSDVIGWATKEGKDAIELHTFGLREELKCTWNFNVRPEKQLSEINPEEYDALAIPGGFEEAGFYEDAYDERILELIRAFNQSGKLIASICVGALPIGKSGILKGRNATTYKKNSIRPQQLEDMGAIIQDDTIVQDKNIITSCGPSSAVDVAFSLLEQLTSKENAAYIRKLMYF